MVDEPTRLGEPPSDRIANYRLGHVIGQGGWGVVYEATNTRNDERVALKLLHAHLAEDEAYLERFHREAQVATLLRSPYTVQLLDFGDDEGRHFLVMKLVEGESLNTALRLGPLAPARALRIASQIGFALEEAEARGVVHRDIKPDNVMLDRSGKAQVLDFGIARQTGRQTLTATGAFIGTLSYAAPEAAEGRVDHRSDLYSLGVTLFHMLTGERPFHGEMVELLHQHREVPMPRGPLAGLDEEIIEVVARLMEKDPDQRYQTASELAGVLEHLATQAAARGDVALDVDETEALAPGGTGVTSALTMMLEPNGRSRRFVPRGVVTNYELVLHNDAPQSLVLHLSTADPSDSCQIEVPNTVVVPPAADIAITVSVVPRRKRWWGAREARPFEVTASGEDGGPPLVVRGEFEDRPQGLVPAAGGAMFSVSLMVVAVLALFGGGGDGDAVAGTEGAVLAALGSAPTATVARAAATSTPAPTSTAAPTATTVPSATATAVPTATPAATAAPAATATAAPTAVPTTAPAAAPVPTGGTDISLFISDPQGSGATYLEVSSRQSLEFGDTILISGASIYDGAHRVLKEFQPGGEGPYWVLVDVPFRAAVPPGGGNPAFVVQSRALTAGIPASGSRIAGFYRGAIGSELLVYLQLTSQPTFSPGDEITVSGFGPYDGLQRVLNVFAYDGLISVLIDTKWTTTPIPGTGPAYASPATRSQQTSGTVEGRVLWNGEPIDNAEVIVRDVWDGTAPQLASGVTDAAGRFSITEVPEGDQFLFVNANGLQSATSSVTPVTVVGGTTVAANDTHLCKGFTATSPVGGVAVTTATPTLRWERPFADAKTYALRLQKVGASFYIFQYGDNGPRTSALSVQVDPPLAPGEYMWRVDAFNAAGNIIGCSYFFSSNFTVTAPN